MKKFLICHKFYDKKYRRISAFGDLQGDTLKIYIVACSKKDTFSRKEAKERLDLYLAEGHLKSYKTTAEAIHPVIYSIPTTSETYKRDFLSFLYDTFYVKEEIIVAIEGTNRVMFCDLYGNLNTKETHATNPRLKTLSEKTRKRYEKGLEAAKIREAQFEAYLEMVEKFNGDSPAASN